MMRLTENGAAKEAKARFDEMLKSRAATKTVAEKERDLGYCKTCPRGAMTDDSGKRPEFAEKIIEKYVSAQSNVFLVYGNTKDIYPVAPDRYVPLIDFFVEASNKARSTDRTKDCRNLRSGFRHHVLRSRRQPLHRPRNRRRAAK